MLNHYEARFAAVGGQGILLAGDILADAAISYEGLFALDSPTYTAQVRGGPTKVDVILDQTRILFPRTTAIDFMLCLAQRSWDRFGTDLKDDCIVLIDPILVQTVDRKYRVYELPVIELTKTEMKKVVYTSAVALGAMIGLTKALGPESVVKALVSKAPKGTEVQNERAFKIGFDAGEALLKN
ncbi:MAG: 2-oxoglutarate:acceptor oxidoreductase [Calditrichaeota bacterium]|nr:2-oxoglutarate:acceptor oxidoreductase [Calditrichota bacterium]